MRTLTMLLCALALVAGGCGESEALPPVGRYALSLDSHAELARGASPFDVKLQASLTLAPSGEPGWLAGTIEAPRFDASEETSADFQRLATELVRPFAVHFQAGRVVEHRFAGGTSAFAAALLRSVTAAMQLPAGTAGDSVAREWDSTGEYEAAYEHTAGGFAKTKRSYTRLHGPAAASQQLPEVRSARVELTLEEGALERVVSRETIRSPLLGGTAIEVANHVELSRLGALSERVALGANLGSPTGVDQPYLDPTPRQAFAHARADGRSVAELIPALEKLEGAVARDSREQGMNARFSAFSALVGQVRSETSAEGQLLAAIRASSPATPSLASALVASGRTAGLIELARDAAAGVSQRRAALSALLRTDSPAEAECELLLSLLSDPAFAEHSRYGLGTFARKLRERGQAERAARLVAPLLAELAHTTEQRQRIILLRGLANAAAPGALAAVRGDLVSSSRSLREGAIHALAMVPGAEVDAAYAERLAHEKDASLRELVLSRIAQHRAPSPALVAALEQLLRDEAASAQWPSARKVLASWQSRKASASLAASPKEPA
jgi:hypothetical protein